VIGYGVNIARSPMDWTCVVHAMCSNGGAKSIYRLRAKPDHETQVASELRLKGGFYRSTLVQDGVDDLDVGADQRLGSIDFGR
jgi:hypothetical protein